MKVLIHGNTYKTIRCPYCNALLEYSNIDIVTQKTDNELTSEMFSYKYIKCLECDTSIILEGLTSCLN